MHRFHLHPARKLGTNKVLRSILGAPLSMNTRFSPARLQGCPLAVRAYFAEAENRRVNIYADYTVYKGRGAMSLKLIKPSWEKTAAGSGLRVGRNGTLLLEFAASKGEREYDWESKEMFGLSAVECGEILEAVSANREQSLFHDPGKMGSEEGVVTKSLRVSPARETGYFFSLTVNNKIAGGTSKFDTIISPGELRVIRTLMEFAIPRLLGFDEVFAGAPDVKEATMLGGYGASGVSQTPPF